jgi:hypothetical protein
MNRKAADGSATQTRHGRKKPLVAFTAAIASEPASTATGRNEMGRPSARRTHLQRTLLPAAVRESPGLVVLASRRTNRRRGRKSNEGSRDATGKGGAHGGGRRDGGNRSGARVRGWTQGCWHWRTSGAIWRRPRSRTRRAPMVSSCPVTVRSSPSCPTVVARSASRLPAADRTCSTPHARRHRLKAGLYQIVVDSAGCARLLHLILSWAGARQCANAAGRSAGTHTPLGDTCAAMLQIRS